MFASYTLVTVQRCLPALLGRLSMSFRPSLRPSTKSVSDLNEICYLGRLIECYTRRHATWPDPRSRSRSRSWRSESCENECWISKFTYPAKGANACMQSKTDVKLWYSKTIWGHIFDIYPRSASRDLQTSAILESSSDNISGTGHPINFVFAFQDQQVEWRDFRFGQIQDGGHNMTWYRRYRQEPSDVAFCQIRPIVFVTSSEVRRSRPSVPVCAENF